MRVSLFLNGFVKIAASILWVEVFMLFFLILSVDSSDLIPVDNEGMFLFSFY